MAFVAGKSTKIIANKYDLSAYFNNMDLTWDKNAPETTTYGVNDRTYLPLGLRGGTISLSGLYDASSNAVDEVLAAALGGAAVPVLIGPDGLSIAEHATGEVARDNADVVYMANSLYTNYSISSPVDGVVAVTADIQAHQGIHQGFSLHDLTARTTTANGNSIDEEAASTSGGVGFLHVTAASGTAPTLDVVIKDSTDDSSFVELIAFTQTATTTAERKTVAGAVSRYVRVEWTIDDTTGGSPSFTFTVGWARY
jgi:hypothetical protein